MTLADLIRRVRTDANDMVEPYFWSDQDVADWLNDAVREAAVRGRLIHESQADAVCRTEVVAGTAVYQLHASLYELSHLGFYPADMSRPTMPVLKSAEVLDVELPEWRACTGKPLYAIQGDTSLRLVPTPDRAGILRVEGYRTPWLTWRWPTRTPRSRRFTPSTTGIWSSGRCIAASASPTWSRSIRTAPRWPKPLSRPTSASAPTPTCGASPVRMFLTM